MGSLYFDEDDAVLALKERGYRVTKVEFPDVENITTVKKLIEFFYYKRTQYNPERKYPYSIDYTEDSRVLSSFVKSREKLGLSRKDSVREAARIIDAMFKYEKGYLYLKEPILSPRILTVRPFIDRVCALLNGEITEATEEDNLTYLDELNQMYLEHFEQKDLERITDERTRIREKLNVKREE